MTIVEPVMMATDYILAAASMFFGISVLSIRGGSERASLLWGIGFILGAASAFLGGTYHGFALYFSDSFHRTLWNVTIVLIGATAGFMVSAVLVARLERNGPGTRPLKSGLFLSIAGLVVQQSPIPLHNELYHLIQTVALYLLYRGSSRSAAVGNQ